MTGTFRANHFTRGFGRLVSLVVAGCCLNFFAVGLAENLGSTFIVIQDQAPLLFYQEGKPTGAEALPRGAYLQAESVAADMVRTTYKGKVGYIQLKFLAPAESILVVAADETELFYIQNGQPSGLARLPKGTLITVETRSGDQVFTTYNGQPAYLRSRSLITTQAFTLAVAQAETAAREQAAQTLAARMEQDIVRIRTRVLDPQKSFLVGEYDKIITNEFGRFMATYPGSPYEKEVNDRIKDWQGERSQVAAGFIKDQGKWKTAAEFAITQRQAQVQAILRDADREYQRQVWSQAAHKYDQAFRLDPSGETALSATQQLAATLAVWRNAIEHGERKINSDLPGVQRAVKEAKWVTARTRAQDNLAYLQAGVTALQRQRGDLSQFESRYGWTEANRVQAGPGSASQPTAPAVGKSPLPADSATPEVVDQVGDFLRAYWIYGLVAVVVIMVVSTRYFSR